MKLLRIEMQKKKTNPDQFKQIAGLATLTVM